jgi:hypothetical protein
MASILGESGENVNGVQEMLREAASRIAIELQGKGSAVAKRSALNHLSGIFVLPPRKASRSMKLVGPLAARAPGLRLALGCLELEIKRHCSADEILQGRLIDLLAFVDVDRAPDIPVEAGVE